ncbi:hypothetical protein, partial [Streptomyces mexicanus]|uniref:hypothetical protein n=1 Tax=Streptomyces mexicanus TaxID=178566 RepID=UPI0013570574
MSEEAPAPRRRPQQRKQVLLRLDPSVYEALARWASDELRSANAQIEFLLRRALAPLWEGSGRLFAPASAAPRGGPAGLVVVIVAVLAVLGALWWRLGS